MYSNLPPRASLSFSSLTKAVLEDLADAEARLKMISDSLDKLAQEIDQFERTDARWILSLRKLGEARRELSIKYTELAMIKAKYGIVGKTWYKRPDKT